MTKTNESSGSLCDAKDSVLLIVDIQTRLTAAMPTKVLARLQRNTSLLINAANKLGVPVFASEQYPKGLGDIEPDIQKILPADVRLYEKTSFSCAGADNFIPDLAATGKKQIIIAGVEAHVCVLQTAIDLYHQGYTIFIAADGVCSRHRENYEIALQRLRRAGVIVCDAESVLFEWLGDASHEKFREVQALIR